MKNTQTITGTTAEVLGPYLAHGVHVAPIGSEYALPFSAYKVFSANFANEVVYCNGLSAGFFFREVLPVLRPFEDLVNPLADGTVPAIEVAKLSLVLAPENASPVNFLYVHSTRKPEPYLSVVAERERTYDLEIILRPDWSIGLIYDWATIPGSNNLSVINYLHKHHFAVGLKPTQFIRETT